jgi:nucleoside-diphosphate-sugar epimerase
VYGQQPDAPIDERIPAQPEDFGGHRLLEAEALLTELACPATVLRLSGIYGPGRTRLLRLAADPTAWPRDNSWTNRIHRDDAAAFIAMLANRVLNDGVVAPCYIVTDGHPAPQHEVLHWLAAQLGYTATHTPSPASGGKRLENAALRTTGFKLRYPDYRAGYAHEIAAITETNQ